MSKSDSDVATRYKHCIDDRALTRRFDDPCYIDCRANTARAPLKYVTRNFHDLGCNPQSLCFPGFMPRDGHGIPSCAVDTDSKLKTETPLTNLGFKQQMRCLPVPTVPFLGKGCLESDTEMQLRGLDTYNDKSCLPREISFYERHFQTPAFEALCYNPNAVEHTVFPYHQVGMDTRHIRQEPHRQGVNCKVKLVEEGVCGGTPESVFRSLSRNTGTFQGRSFQYVNNKNRCPDRFGKSKRRLYNQKGKCMNRFCKCGSNCKCGANCKC